MSPRAAVTRHDRTALRLLTAAAELIQQSMDPAGHQHPRLRSIRFPAALDWIRIEDVLRTATEHPEGPVSRKALVNRWETREEFLRDAIVFAMLYHGDPSIELVDPADLVPPAGSSYGDVVVGVIEDLYARLLAHPRSFLLCQFAPYFGLHPQMAARVAAAGAAEHDRWVDTCAGLFAGLPVELRPEWDVERAGAALRCVLDGFVMRRRIQPSVRPEAGWTDASLLADTVLALLTGMLDLAGDGQTVHAQLDFGCTRARPHATPAVEGADGLLAMGA